MPYTSYALLGAARSHRVDSPTASGRTTNGRPNACNLCHLDRTLAWTRDHLSEWYGAPGPELEPEHEEVAAAVLWALRGDAGQRSLTAWHMGQPWALEASRDDWVAPYLAHLLTDPYSATRLIAHRSLRRVAPGGALPYDHLGPADERAATSRAQLRQWSEAWIADGAVAPPATLVEVGGRLRPDRVYQLLRQRDDSAIVLAE